MDTEELKTRKSVSISRIKPGMYVVSLDRSWFQTPFYLHRRLIKNAEEIEQLKKLGVRGAHFKAFAVDLRNHGRSPHSDIFDNDVMSADLREFMKRQALRA